MLSTFVDEQSRESPWRQGMVFDDQTILTLLPTWARCFDQTVVVVASHDCDIASSPKNEPVIEVIVGQRITALGADTHAKTARRLHIEFQTPDGPIAVELVATNKVPVPKDALLQASPLAAWQLSVEDLVTLQLWLAARYRRAAFADEFERRLKAKPARLDKKIAKSLDVPSEHVLAVFFEVDDGSETHRNGPDDVYDLRITLLYDSTKDEPAAYEATQKAAVAIEDSFEKAFCEGGVWKNIRLMSCIPVSDSAMTVAQSRLMKQWRLDYISLEEAPHESMLTSS